MQGVKQNRRVEEVSEVLRLKRKGKQSMQSKTLYFLNNECLRHTLEISKKIPILMYFYLLEPEVVTIGTDSGFSESSELYLEASFFSL